MKVGRVRSPESVAATRWKRWAVPAGVALVSVLGVGWVLDDGGDSDLELEVQGSTGDSEDVVADTEWPDAVLSEDGLLLTIRVGSAPAGDDPCSQNLAYEVIETGKSVTVGFDEQPPPPAPEGVNIGCNASHESQWFEIELDAPLGDREVFDGVRPGPKNVQNVTETVDVTVVPDGWTGGPSPWGVDGNDWQQAFGKQGADWYFVVSQQPEADAYTPEGTPTPVTVHGIEGLRYSRQMNNTMETIV